MSYDLSCSLATNYEGVKQSNRTYKVFSAMYLKKTLSEYDSENFKCENLCKILGEFVFKFFKELISKWFLLTCMCKKQWDPFCRE